MRVLLRAIARRASRLSTVVLLLGLSAPLAVPQDVVWCQGSSGHSALELAGAACCAPAGGDRTCATSPAPLEPQAAGASLVPGNDRCADLWLGGPVAVSPSPTAPPPGLEAVALPGAVPPVCGGPAQPRAVRLDATAAAASRADQHHRSHHLILPG
jgi:hypothetical protein